MKLSRRILRLLTIHSALLILMVFIIFAVSLIYYKNEDLKEQAMNLAHTAADLIDADAVNAYVLNREADAAYLETEEKLKRLKSNFGKCVFMYVYAPYNDEFALYIYDIYNDGDIIPEGGGGYLGFEETWDNLQFGHSILQTGGEIKKLEYSIASEYGNLISYSVPVFDSYGNITAIVGIDYSLDDFIQFIVTLLVAMLLLVIVAKVILSVYEVRGINRFLIEPIKNIENKTIAFASSDHDGNSEQYMLKEVPNSENELDILAGAINKMICDTDEYIKNIAAITKERQRIGIELDVAKRIQASALPRKFPAFPERTDFDIYASMDPAKEVGGDFYDFFLMDDDHLCLVIADVSGKGVGAALFMMISKVLINNQAFYVENPSKLLEDVNKRLCANNEAEMFVTVWLGMLQLSTGVMKCANAGHEFPAIKKKDGQFELFKDKHGFVLGGMDMARYKEYELKLEPGDRIFVYTDGVPEATNANNELFGTDRMIETLNRYSDSDCEHLLINVRKDIDAFVGEAEQFDDITMLNLYYKGAVNA